MKNEIFGFSDMAIILVCLIFGSALHELSHLFMASGLGYGADIICSSGIPVGVALHSLPSAFDATLIVLAGGIGSAIVLYLLWRVLRKGLAGFAFVISAELSYAGLETLWYFGWIARSVAVCLPIFVGIFMATIASLQSQMSWGRSR